MSTIRKRGTKWQVQIRRRGFAPLTRTFAFKADALEWARDREVLADRHDLPPSAKALDAITLRDLVVRYRDEVVPDKRGALVETIVMNAFLRDSICSKRLSQLTTADFATYRDRRLAEVAGTTLRRQLAPLRNMFEIARMEWKVPLRRNPLDNLPLQTMNRKRHRRLREGEFDQLVAAATKTRNHFLLPVIRFALETAMRRGEILAMKWHHLDLQRRLLVIPEAKNGHSRIIPLTPTAVAILNDTERTNEKVFPITPNALRLAWDRLIERGSIADLHFHDLRHEAISRFLEMGLTIPEVALISGHRDLRMLMRYAHASCSRIAAQLASLERETDD